MPRQFQVGVGKANRFKSRIIKLKLLETTRHLFTEPPTLRHGYVKPARESRLPGRPRRVPGRSTDPGCSGNEPGRYVSLGRLGTYLVMSRRQWVRRPSIGTPPWQRNAKCGKQSARPRQSLPAARPPIEMSPGAAIRIRAAASNKLVRARAHGPRERGTAAAM